MRYIIYYRSANDDLTCRQDSFL